MAKKYEEVLTKEFLEEEYVEKKKGLMKISQAVKISHKTIYVYLKKYGIKRNSKINLVPKLLTKKFLSEEYIDNKKSITQISKQTNYCQDTISKYLKKFNIITRGKTLYVCKNCGKEIGYYKKRCKSCEIKRRHLVGIINLKQENHPNWKGGKSFEEYPKEFNKKLKEKIRKRDKYTCQNCDMVEEECLIVLGEVLTIHHIDYNKKNCNEENLISLCKQCNSRVNFNRKKWKKYFIQKTTRREQYE